jgi:hypothetical protein
VYVGTYFQSRQGVPGRPLVRRSGTFELGLAAGQPDAQAPFGGQLTSLRNNQGRIAELVDVMRANVEAMAHLLAWRANLARLYAETDRLMEAREQIAVLRMNGFDHPLNWMWASNMMTLSEAVCDLHDTSAIVDVAC